MIENIEKSSEDDGTQTRNHLIDNPTAPQQKAMRNPDLRQEWLPLVGNRRV